MKSFNDTTSRIQFPAEIYWDNYNKIIQSGEIFTGIKNCLIITVFVLLVEIVIGCMAAYGLARNQSKLNEVVRSLIMSVMMITPLTILVGVYSTMSKFHATSTYWGMVLVLSAFGLPLVIFLYTNFISSIPVALDEAAAIDGCGPIRTFFIVIIPMLKPTLISVGILEIMWIWNDYLLPYLVLDLDQYRTIPIHIQYLQGSYGSVDLGAIMALIILSIIPVIFFYLTCQKHIIKGVAAGAVKG